MGSSDSTSKSAMPEPAGSRVPRVEGRDRPGAPATGSPMMPGVAILRHELRSLWSSWLVRIWLAGTAVLTLLLVGSGWERLPTATLLSVLQFPYLFFPWVLVVMVLAVMPVTGARIEALADGFLSRPVTRYEFLLASWAARVVTVLGVYLAVTVPAVVLVGLADRPAAGEPVTVFGVLAALSVVGLVLTFLTSLGFLLGTLMGKPLLPLVILVFFWYPINAVMDAYSLEELSPLSLNRSMATLLRRPWPGAQPAETAAADPASLRSELPSWTAQFVKALSESPPEPKREAHPFFESDEFQDFSLWRVFLGYGLPALAAVSLATVCFCRRDL